MDVLHIYGGMPLSGTILASGSKNAALPVFAAALLTEEPCIIENVPGLSDIRLMIQILEHMRAKTSWVDTTTAVIHAQVITAKTPYELVRKMRASICLSGALVGRMNYAEVPLPGGCITGQRP